MQVLSSSYGIGTEKKIRNPGCRPVVISATARFVDAPYGKVSDIRPSDPKGNLYQPLAVNHLQQRKSIEFPYEVVGIPTTRTSPTSLRTIVVCSGINRT